MNKTLKQKYSTKYTHRLKYYRQSLDFFYSDFKDYIIESQTSLKQKQRDMDKDFLEIQNNIQDEDERQMAADFFLDENLKYYQSFPKHLNESLFLIIYSYFEVHLSKVCHFSYLDIRVASSEAFPIAEFKGTYIRESREYLKTKCNISIPEGKGYWKQIGAFREYRNFIAHDNADLRQVKKETNKKKVLKHIKYINQYFKKPLKKDEFSRYSIEENDLLLHFLDLTKNFLFDTIEKVIKKHKLNKTRYKS